MCNGILTFFVLMDFGSCPCFVIRKAPAVISLYAGNHIHLKLMVFFRFARYYDINYGYMQDEQIGARGMTYTMLYFQCIGEDN